MKNKRLEREPDYNLKRRNGAHSPHLDTCTACGYRIPQDLDTACGQAIPCSEFHTRCVRCHWPVETSHLSPEGLCVICRPRDLKLRYYLRTKVDRE